MTRAGHVQRVVVQLSTEQCHEGSYSTNAVMTCRLQYRNVCGRGSQHLLRRVEVEVVASLIVEVGQVDRTGADMPTISIFPDVDGKTRTCSRRQTHINSTWIN